MTMTVAFSESDISKIKVGQPANVTLEALSGVELAAHVSAISRSGRPAAAWSATTRRSRSTSAIPASSRA